MVVAPPLPARPQAALGLKCDMIAAIDCDEYLRWWMEDELRTLDNVASDLGLKEDPLSMYIRKCLRALAK